MGQLPEKLSKHMVVSRLLVPRAANIMLLPWKPGRAGLLLTQRHAFSDLLLACPSRCWCFFDVFLFQFVLCCVFQSAGHTEQANMLSLPLPLSLGRWFIASAVHWNHLGRLKNYNIGPLLLKFWFSWSGHRWVDQGSQVIIIYSQCCKLLVSGNPWDSHRFQPSNQS